VIDTLKIVSVSSWPWQNQWVLLPTLPPSLPPPSQRPQRSLLPWPPHSPGVFPVPSHAVGTVAALETNLKVHLRDNDLEDPGRPARINELRVSERQKRKREKEVTTPFSSPIDDECKKAGSDDDDNEESNPSTGIFD
jgi:hypothetical protein